MMIPATTRLCRTEGTNVNAGAALRRQFVSCGQFGAAPRALCTAVDKFRSGCAAALAVFALLTASGAAQADIRIGNDDGGVLSAYQAKVAAARASGERVVVDGRCASGCTLYLALPREQICATSRAVFVFHTAADARFGLPDWRANEAMMNAFPPHVRIAIGQRGGLWLDPIAIKGTALARPCRRTR